jgi:peptidyl-prolyl cis-trans isomerase D
MLAQLRKYTQGWVAGAIVLLLALAFAIWGMPNMFSAAGRPIARVNGEAVGAQEVERAFAVLLRPREPGGAPTPRNQAIQAGLHRQALESLIYQEAVFGFVRRLGVTASDQQVADEIRGNQAFWDPFALSGEGFSGDVFRQQLAENGFTVSEYESAQRELLAAEQLIGAMSAGARAPRSFALARLAFESERRSLSVTQIPDSAVGTIPAPDAAALQAFYEERGQAWAEPERRTLLVAVADAANFEERVQVTDEQLRQEYERNAEQWSQPERRTFVQVTAPTEQAAQAAAARLAAGAPPEAVATEVGGQVITFEDTPRSEVPDDVLGAAVFSLEPGSAPTAVRGSLSPWSAVRLAAVTPGQQTSFEDAAPEIRAAIVGEQSYQAMQEAMSEFDQQRRRRVAFEEAASSAGLALLRLDAVDVQGRTAEGAPATALEGIGPLIQEAFAVRQGARTDWMRASETVEVLAQVQEVIPSREPPLSEVEDEVRVAWRLVETDRRLTELAAEVAQEASGGDLVRVARSRGFPAEPSPRPLTRQEIGQAFGQQLALQALTAPEGRAVFGYRMVVNPETGQPVGRVMLVIQVADIERADPAEAPEAVEQLRVQESLQLRATLSNALGDAMRRDADVTINEGDLDARFPQTTE